MFGRNRRLTVYLLIASMMFGIIGNSAYLSPHAYAEELVSDDSYGILEEAGLGEAEEAKQAGGEASKEASLAITDDWKGDIIGDEYILWGYAGNAADIVVPASISVTTSENALKEYKVVIGENFSWVSYDQQQNMIDHSDNILSLVVSEGVSFKNPSISSNLFTGLRNLRTAELGGLISAENADTRYMFKDCSSLETVDFGAVDFFSSSKSS